MDKNTSGEAMVLPDNLSAYTIKLKMRWFRCYLTIRRNYEIEWVIKGNEIETSLWKLPKKKIIWTSCVISKSHTCSGLSVSRMFGVNLQALLSYTYVPYLVFSSSLSLFKEHYGLRVSMVILKTGIKAVAVMSTHWALIGSCASCL